MTKVAPEAQRGPCADPRVVIDQAQRELATQAPEMPGILSPIFPGVWPPAGEPIAILYAYVRSSMSTSTDRWQVASPFMKLEVGLSGALGPMRLERLKTRPLGMERNPVTQATPEVMEQAAARLLGAVCAEVVPSFADAAMVRASYRAWIIDHSVLAEELRSAVPEFFKWIEGND